MAMGTRRQGQRQEELWYRGDLAEAPGHPFYRRLNELLDQAGLDEFCEAGCQKFYHEKLGRASLAPGIYFRVMLIGFFEGIESERGIAWRVADSLCLREFLRIGLDEPTADHVLAVVVNRQNPLNNISVAELQRIFTGERRFWNNSKNPVTVIMLALGAPGRDA